MLISSFISQYLRGMDLNLKNKRAIVCGSTRGIGKAVAIELASLGANVTLIARNELILKGVAGDLPNDGTQKHNYLVADFSKPEQLKAIMQRELKNSAVHILVNNTGGPPGGEIANADEAEFLAAFNSHLICNHIMVQAVLDKMKNAGYGRIINIISTSVKQPIPGLGVSNTIRAAVANWAKTLSLEVGKFGITVNNVLPGFTNTDRLTTIIDSKAQKTGKTKEDIIKEMLTETPSGRFAQPEEIASSVAFLASPAAAYINGVSLCVDGGRTLSH